MGIFANNAITDVGRILLAEAQAGAVFTPTRLVIGSGNMPSGKTVESMTDVITPVKSLEINKKMRTPDGKFICGGVYTNEDITSPFYFRELALYAKPVYINANGTVTSEGAEVLYSYGNAGATADLMPAYSTNTVVERQIDLITWIGNTATVNMVIESGLADFIPMGYMGTPEGVATLGADGRIPAGQLPSMDYVRKTGDTMSDTLSVDKGAAWAGFRAQRTINGEKYNAVFAVGAAGNGAIEMTNQNNQRTARVDFGPKGLEFDLAGRFAAQVDQNAFASGETILAFAWACKVDTTKHITGDPLPSDAPVASTGVLDVKVSGEWRQVTFSPYGSSHGKFLRNIRNGGWIWDWMRVGPLFSVVSLYVSASGNDTTGNGSQAAPFKTMTKALSIIGKDLGGQAARIYVSPGNYNDSIYLQGITNGNLLISATDFNNRPTFTNNVTINDCASVTLSGININQATFPNAVSIVRTLYAYLDRCTMTGSVSRGCVSVAEGSTAYLYSCTFNSAITVITCASAGRVAASNCNGTGNGTVFMASDNGLITDGLANSIAGTTKYATANGGRVFAGAQTSVPNY